MHCSRTAATFLLEKLLGNYAKKLITSKPHNVSKNRNKRLLEGNNIFNLRPRGGL